MGEHGERGVVQGFGGGRNINAFIFIITFKQRLPHRPPVRFHQQQGQHDDVDVGVGRFVGDDEARLFGGALFGAAAAAALLKESGVMVFFVGA